MSGAELRVLVVDDDRVLRRALTLALEDAVRLADAADGAHAALAHIARQPYDVVVTDVEMGASNGLTLLGQLRARGCPAAVVVMSASADPDLPARALALGAAAFLPKPFDLADLEAVLWRLAAERAPVPAERAA